MQLTCPGCQFSKQIDAASIPAEATRATCPKCGQSFELPARMSKDTEIISPQPDDRREYTDRKQKLLVRPKAGFWLRLVAAVLDGLLIAILQTLLGALLAVVGFVASDMDPQRLAGLLLLFSYLIGIAYYVVFTGSCGQTPGKMALRIKVIRCDGGRVDFNRAALREIGGKTVAGIIFGIGLLMVAFDEQKQGLHDRMAGTYVVKL